MLKIIYIEDERRPERNVEFKEVIHRLGFEDIISFCDDISVENIASLTADGVIFHSGMTGYQVVNHFAKKKNWSLLSYSGSVDGTPFLRESSFKKNQFSVDSDYFESVLPEFIERCKKIKGSRS
jgi:predicted urease superfamily metal-dependent hydrolase